MEMYAVRPYNGRQGDLDISTLFWGALIVVALVAACLLVGKAIGTLGNQRKFDGAGDVNQQRGSATRTGPITAQSRPVTKPHRRLTELLDGDTVGGGHIADPEDDPLVDSLLDRGWGFSKHEEEKFLLIHGPRKVRKAIKERRKAREQAKKKQSDL